MNVQQSIEASLRAALPLEHLDILNESHKHAGPGTETHFKVTAVSPAFAGLGPVRRHQWMYELLLQQLRDGVHALALHTYTPEEWARKNGVAPRSPDCAGAAH
jgi:BolA protein